MPAAYAATPTQTDTTMRTIVSPREQIAAQVVRATGGAAQAGEVIIGGSIVGGIGIFADVKPDDAGPFSFGDIGEGGLEAWVVESHAVDDGIAFHEAEQAGAGITGLRARGDGAHLDVSEAEGAEGVHAGAGFVHTGGEADAVGEIQTHEADWGTVSGRSHESGQPAFFRPAQGGQGGVVSGLGIEAKENWPGELVQEIESGGTHGGDV